MPQGRLRLKCDGTRAETRVRLSAKRTSPFKSAGASVQSTAGSRVVRISCSNVGHNIFRGSVKSTCYPLHSSVSPSLPLPCVTVCHHISTGLYNLGSSSLHVKQAQNTAVGQRVCVPLEVICFHLTVKKCLWGLSFGTAQIWHYIAIASPWLSFRSCSYGIVNGWCSYSPLASSIHKWHVGLGFVSHADDAAVNETP